MTGAAKRKGDQAEREAATLIADHLGYPVRRKLGAGRQDDEGDLEGVPNTTLQVASWADVTRAMRVKPLEVETQRANAGTPFAATFLRLRGGDWRVVLTVEQWAALTREALS
jgi:hypothetical protein